MKKLIAIIIVAVLLVNCTITGNAYEYKTALPGHQFQQTLAKDMASYAAAIGKETIADATIQPTSTPTSTTLPLPTPTLTSGLTPTSAPTIAPIPSPVLTPTPMPTPTPTSTPTPTQTLEPTLTPIPSPTPMPTPTQTPKPTPSPKPIQTPKPTTSSTTTPKPKPETKQLIIDAKVYATLLQNTKLFKRGTRVEITDLLNQRYTIKANGRTELVRWYQIRIDKEPKTNPHRLTAQEVETAMKSKKLKSATAYKVWIDLNRQMLYVLKNDKTVKMFECATGRNITPTKRGVFSIRSRGYSFFTAKYGVGARYWMSFCGDYLIHAQPIYRNGRLADATINKRASHGCVRLKEVDAKWAYKTIPTGTLVWVN